VKLDLAASIGEARVLTLAHADITAHNTFEQKRWSSRRAD